MLFPVTRTPGGLARSDARSVHIAQAVWAEVF
jgi:hypothetical protein